MKDKILQIAVSMVLAVVLSFSCVSCGLRVEATELSKGYERKASESGQITDEFKAAMADFSMSLLRSVTNKGNKSDGELVSPVSAMLCLAMIANGADGETLAQMEDVLGMDVDTLNKALFAFAQSIDSTKECKVNIANSIWLRDDWSLRVNEDFLQTNADWYDAEVYAAPFNDTTIKDINKWCDHNTDGMIDKVLDRIDGGLMLVLISALAFDAKWEEKYENNAIKDGTFNNYDGTGKQLKMLSSEENVYLAADGVSGFAKNYKGGAYSFVGLLPDNNTDVFDFIDSLTGEKWMNLWNNRLETNVDVVIPEFSVEKKMDLTDVLRDMGMTDVFCDRADFTRMTTLDGDKIYCSKVCQDTFIDVSRNGTKAAAVTSGLLYGGINENVTLDRPFVYAIVDNASGIPLFFGAAVNM